MSIHVYNGINMCSLSDIICKIWVKLALILTGLIIMFKWYNRKAGGEWVWWRYIVILHAV